MNLSFHLKLAGASMWALGAAHLYFARRFRWKEELVRLSLLNRQIFQVHCFFIVLILALFGTLSLAWTPLLLQPSPLARVVLGGLSIFWGARVFVQFFVYDPSLWRGHPFNTAMHIMASLGWSYYAAVYGMALWRQFAAGG